MTEALKSDSATDAKLIWSLDKKDMEAIDYYQGLPVFADSIEVHEQAFALLKEHLSPQARILDVAAGAGAFSRRLVDNGFKNIEATEIRAEDFTVDGVPVHSVDLNQLWASQLNGKFDAIVGIEIIEHLENPWHFVRQCAQALRPGGLLLLSTPNIESSRSRIEFLLRAEFHFFGQKDFEKVGHLTPLSSVLIRRICSRAGLEWVERRYSRHKGMPRGLKKLKRMFFYAISYPFMRGDKHGEVSLFLFRLKSA